MWREPSAPKGSGSRTRRTFGDALHQALTCGRRPLLDVRIDKEVWAPVTNFEDIVPRDV